MPDPDIRRVRITGFIEACSALLLFGIAMPLKYLASMPMAVTVVGSIHGVLWVIYAVVAIQAWSRKKLSGGWVWLLGLVSFVPFGPFLLDPKLKRMEQNLARV